MNFSVSTRLSMADKPLACLSNPTPPHCPETCQAFSPKVHLDLPPPKIPTKRTPWWSLTCQNRVSNQIFCFGGDNIPRSDVSVMMIGHEIGYFSRLNKMMHYCYLKILRGRSRHSISVNMSADHAVWCHMDNNPAGEIRE